MRAARKIAVSGFVVCTFVAYALHERTSNPDNVAPALGAIAPTLADPTIRRSSSAPAATAPVFPTLPPPIPSPNPAPAATPLPASPTPAAPPASPTPAASAGAQFKDGQYTGTVADALYGTVQVKATIQQGKLADVQFLDYPHDRRTSVRINSVAVPDLTSEALQAQSASVDIISGATLTSQAFIESLQSALIQAKP